MQKTQFQSAPVTDPYTGKTYDLGPLFHYLHEQTMQPKDVGNWCALVADDIPQFMEESANVYFIDENLRAFSFVKELRDMFRRINEVKTEN